MKNPDTPEEKKALLESYQSRLEEIKAIMSGNAPPEPGRTDMAPGRAPDKPDSAGLLTNGDTHDKPHSAGPPGGDTQDTSDMTADRGAQDKDTDNLDSILKMAGASDNIEQNEKESEPPEPGTSTSELDDVQVQQIKDEIRRALARLESAEIP